MKEEILKKKLTVLPSELKPVKVSAAKAKSFAETVTETDRTYTISSVYDLKNERVKLPKGVTLKFTGTGKLTNGTIIGDRCKILAEGRVFYNVQVEGGWECVGNAFWFTDGCDLGETAAGVPFILKYVDDCDGLQDLLDSSFGEVVFPPRLYYTSETLVLRWAKKITMQGPRLALSLADCPDNMRRAAVIFTNRDKDLLEIMVRGYDYHKSVEIEGGNFDVSLCEDYQASGIKVVSDRGERIWGLTINTAIFGFYKTSSGVGIDINPTKNEESDGYITDVRINANVYNFGTGVKVRDYVDNRTMKYFNWCSDVVIDGCISHCRVAVDSTADCDIRAMIQAGYFYDTKDNGVPLIRYGGLWCAVSSNIYDIRMTGDGGKWSNGLALEVADEDATVAIGGLFLARYLASKRLGWPFVEGKVNH